MRIAIIDCGTNTFHLLIVNIMEKGKFNKLYKTKAAVKLGEGGITKKFISETPFNRGIRALKRFAGKIAEYNVDIVYAFGTAALRKAKNKDQFIAAAKNESGIKLQLISGNQEAALIYKGVREAVPLGDEKSLVMDIGGGSVEFIICNKYKIFWKHSFDIGAALLLEKLKPSNPISITEIKKLHSYLQKTLSPLFTACKKHAPVKLIGSSGSFDTFAEMILQQKERPKALGKRISYIFNLDDYRLIHQQLIKSTSGQRMKMKGLVRMRVDMIVLASLLLTFVLEKTGIIQMTLSAYALKEGILFSEIDN